MVYAGQVCSLTIIEIDDVAVSNPSCMPVWFWSSNENIFPIVTFADLVPRLL